MQVQSLGQEDSVGQEDSLDKGMGTQSSILFWRIPWTEEPNGLQSIVSQKVRHDLSDLAQHSIEIFFPCNFHICSDDLLFTSYKGSLKASYKVGFIVLNSFWFCFSVKLLISPSNLNESLP